MQSNVRQLQSIAVFIRRYIIISLLFMISCTCILVTVYGIKHDFLAKKTEVQKHSHFIGNLLSLAEERNIELSEHSFNDLIDHDGVIQGIKIYELNDHELTTETDNDWYTALLTDSYVVNEHLVFHNTDNNGTDSTNLSANRKHKHAHYISIMLDLKELRKLWFKQHAVLFVLIPLLYLIVGTLIYLHSLRIRRQLLILQKIGNGLIDQDGVVSLPMSSMTMSFVEYHDIKTGIVKLVHLYDQTQQKVISLQDKVNNITQQSGDINNQDDNKFFVMMVSELSHSLNVMNGALDILSNQYLSDDQNSAVGSIRKGTQQLEFVLSQVTQLQKIQKGQVLVNQVEFNPLQLLSDVLTNFRTKNINENVELVTDIIHSDHMLEGDVDKIQRIINALISNALKYTFTGYVKLSSSLQHFNQTTRWTVSVRDTGIGIESKNLDQIFLPFYQVNNDINKLSNDIGVGLTLAKQLTELLGGTLTASSEFGKGAEFELVIPLLKKGQRLESNYLQGKKVTYFDAVQEYALAEELSHYGVERLTTFHNMDETILHLGEHTTDVLLIASRFDSKSVDKMLTVSFRSLEKNHRSLVVWLNQESQSTMKSESMQAIGVDVWLEKETSAKQVAKTIKEWLS